MERPTGTGTAGTRATPTRPSTTPAGRRREQLAESLKTLELDAIYTSDLRRAAETAEIIGAGRGIPIVHDPGLREIDVGSWSGLTREEIEERFPGAAEHDGESRDQHLDRVRAAVERIAARHAGERILIVSHGGSIRTLRTACAPGRFGAARGELHGLPARLRGRFTARDRLTRGGGLHEQVQG